MPQTRITAGDFRGRALSTPKGMPLRPTRSLVREALFNILGETIDDARFVDLYAGVGSVGLEALSRGAEHVTFVEKTRAHLALIADTSERFGCADRCDFVLGDVVTWLRGAGRRVVAAADIVFMDAPYQDNGADLALELLGASPPPLVVCEHHRDRKIAENVGGLERVRQARYGLTELTFLKPAGETPTS